MSLSLVLKPRVLRTYDSDAASYISAVESADNQTLESGIKDAINEFVVGCKIRGIWESIKSCCLLCGARTLDGAIVPLKGAAPILTSFVGDYNRETGLRRTSGSFNINRNNNADPADNKHVAIYPTSLDYGSSTSNFRALLTASTAAGSTSFALNSSGLNAKVNTTLNLIANAPVISGNLIGISVLNSSTSQLLYNNIIGTKNIDIITPANIGMTLFAGSGVSTSLSRISYYSVGERLDLRLLKQVVDRYMLDIINATVWDSEALNYITNVENADNDVLEDDIKKAINNFIKACKRDKIWGSIEASCFLCGARTLNGALIPLVGAAPTNVNFSVSDYDRKTGLLGNGSTKYLNSNRSNSADPQISNHNAVYASSISSTNGSFIGSSNSNVTSTGTNWIGGPSGASLSLFTRSRSSTGVEMTRALVPGLIGMSRINSANYFIRFGKVNEIISVGSTAPVADNIFLYRRGDGSTLYGAHRLSFYSIGSYLDLSLLDKNVSIFQDNINNIL